MNATSKSLLVSVLLFAQPAFGQRWLQASASAPPPAKSIAIPNATGGTVSVGSATVRLPPGDWVLAGEEAGVGHSVSGPTSAKIERKILYQMEGGKLASIISISSNVGYESNGWLVPAYCFRHDIFYRNNNGEYPSHYDCLGINHIILRTNRARTSSALWRAVYARIEAVAPLPEQMIAVGYNYLRPNRGQFVAMDVYLNPEASGFAPARTSWIGSPWHRLNLDGKHRAYLEQAVRWAESYRENVRDAW